MLCCSGGQVMRLVTLSLVALAAHTCHAMDCGGGGSATAASLQLQLLNVPEAVCNDGTSSGKVLLQYMLVGHLWASSFFSSRLICLDQKVPLELDLSVTAEHTATY